MVYGSVIKILGNLLLVEAALMIPSLLVSIYYDGSDKMAFIISIIITSLVGLIMSKSFRFSKSIKAREGLTIVALDGFMLHFGSLPFIFSGSILSWLDAF